MKIAVSGSAGIGKTTLGRALSEALGSLFIEENYEPFFESAGKFNSSSEILGSTFIQVLEDKHRIEMQHGDFVTDRCPIDLFHLWLVKGLSADIQATEDFHRKCFDSAREYDFVVLPPWGSFPLKPIEDPKDHKRRDPNPWVQLRNHATINGYTHMWIPPKKIIVIPRLIVDHDQRLEFVLKKIHARKQKK